VIKVGKRGALSKNFYKLGQHFAGFDDDARKEFATTIMNFD